MNLYDDIEYIIRLVRFLESVFPSKVIAIVVFPFDSTNKWSILGSVNKKASEKDILYRSRKIEKALHIKIFDLTKDISIYNISKKIIKYFSKKRG